MGAAPAHPTLRFRRSRRHDDPDRAYRFTIEAIDEGSGAILAHCDVRGTIAFSIHAIHGSADAGDGPWHLAPNRPVMPTRWLLTDLDGALALQFDQHLRAKLLNPFQGTGIVLRDADGNERFRLVDARTGALDRIMGPGPSDWALLRDRTKVAALTRLARTGAAQPGWRGWIAEWLSERDLGLVALADPSPLAAPEGVALVLLIAALSETSATA